MLDAKIIQIMEAVEVKEDGPVFTEESKLLIKEAAVLAKETAIYKRTEKDRPEEFKNGKAADLYIEMLGKIVNAPTSIHMAAVPRLMLPAISDALEREEDTNGKPGCDVQQ